MSQTQSPARGCIIPARLPSLAPGSIRRHDAEPRSAYHAEIWNTALDADEAVAYYSTGLSRDPARRHMLSDWQEHTMSYPHEESMGDILADAKKMRAELASSLGKLKRDGVRPNSPLTVEQTEVMILGEIARLDKIIRRYEPTR